jgi:GNAT superfamily N-acetyltransferase
MNEPAHTIETFTGWDALPSEADVQKLEDEINTFNRERTGFNDFQRLGWIIRDVEGIAGGIAGWTWGGCCEIRSLWVRESLRGQGLGRQLLNRAEEEARRRSCSVIVLDTHSFQAPDFYEKQGYETVGVVEGYPQGYSKYFFQKRLF